MKGRSFLLLFLIILNTFILTGCWNYREVEKLSVVAGVAIDKGKHHKYQITVETVEISGGQEVKQMPHLITIEGDTVFDAVRNEISLTGKKLYWSHTKVVIISKEIAREGILRVIDWFNRDSETRADVLLLVSKGKNASDILKGKATTERMVSFELDDMNKNEKSLSKAPLTDIWKFTNNLELPGIVPALPAVNLKKSNNHFSPQIEGTAIFSQDKLLGFINGDETKDLLFVLDEVKGGLLNTSGINKLYHTPISLEIFKSKTKTTPVIKKDLITFNVQIDTTVALDELGGSVDLLKDGKLKQLEQHAGKILKTRIEKNIKHIQATYGVDVFGFGEKLREEKPKIWNRVASRWEKDKFKDLKVNVSAKVHIKGSGMLSKPIQIGD
jgi:spore germination protein KC